MMQLCVENVIFCISVQEFTHHEALVQCRLPTPAMRPTPQR